MLKELNEYLAGEMSDDYWYDEALSICEDILKKFSNEKWSELLKAISNKSIRWKIRLAECMGDFQNLYELQCIIQMIDTDNDDLFIACTDSLRSMDLSSIQERDKSKIRHRIHLMLETSSPPVKKVLENFLKNC